MCVRGNYTSEGQYFYRALYLQVIHKMICAEGLLMILTNSMKEKELMLISMIHVGRGHILHKGTQKVVLNSDVSKIL